MRAQNFQNNFSTYTVSGMVPKNEFMKTIIITSIVLFCSSIAFGQNYNQAYSTINLFNTTGQNPHDVIFSYDVVNGTSTCANNFEVVSKLNTITTFNFRIFLNDVAVYTGQVVNLPAYGRFFFDNAFANCN